MAAGETILTGWGLRPAVKARLEAPRDLDALRARVAEGREPLIARGGGRSYGDSSFNAHGAVSTLGLNRMISLDTDGLLACEAGVVLGDVVAAMLPRGWFPPVTPGTKFVTIGGMIASNVHGKNAVRDGAFGDHVAWFDLLRADGTLVRCSPQENADLFAHTIGGMGLTGVIARAAFRLKPVETGWVRQERIACKDLDAALEAFEASESATYRVAWIDVLASGARLGRSILDIGEHAVRAELGAKEAENPYAWRPRAAKTVPFAPPISPLNALTVRAFNAVHYRRGAASVGDSLVDWDGYFYPLDSLLHWNRIYGRRGFAQYQCALPRAGAREGLVALLEAISGSGRGSFLAVLKRLGPTCGTLSFPIDGYTLALDFPWSDGVARLLDALDAIVLRAGGRIYLTKDSRLTQDTYHALHPEAAAFAEARARDGSAARFASLQSQRLGL